MSSTYRSQLGGTTAGSWRKNLCCLTVCVSWLSQSALYTTLDPLSRDGTTHSGWTFSHQSFIKKMHHRFVHRPTLILNRGFLMSSGCSFYQHEKKLDTSPRGRDGELKEESVLKEGLRKQCQVLSS